MLQWLPNISVYCNKPPGLKCPMWSGVRYPVHSSCTYEFPSCDRSWQALCIWMVWSLEMFLARAFAEQLLHVVSVQLVSHISFICCPDVVLSYHTVLGKGFPVEIAHLGAPAVSRTNETRSILGWSKSRSWRWWRRRRRWRWKKRRWRRWWNRWTCWLHLLKGDISAGLGSIHDLFHVKARMWAYEEFAVKYKYSSCGWRNRWSRRDLSKMLSVGKRN